MMLGGPIENCLTKKDTKLLDELFDYMNLEENEQNILLDDLIVSMYLVSGCLDPIDSIVHIINNLIVFTGEIHRESQIKVWRTDWYIWNTIF